MYGIYTSLNNEIPVILSGNLLTALKAKAKLSKQLGNTYSVRFHLKFVLGCSDELKSKAFIARYSELEDRCIRLVLKHSGPLFRQTISLLMSSYTSESVNRVGDFVQINAKLSSLDSMVFGYKLKQTTSKAS